jgi:hypothetical protein
MKRVRRRRSCRMTLQNLSPTVLTGSSVAGAMTLIQTLIWMRRLETKCWSMKLSLCICTRFHRKPILASTKWFWLSSYSSGSAWTISGGPNVYNLMRLIFQSTLILPIKWKQPSSVLPTLQNTHPRSATSLWRFTWRTTAQSTQLIE